MLQVVVDGTDGSKPDCWRQELGRDSGGNAWIHVQRCGKRPNCTHSSLAVLCLRVRAGVPFQFVCSSGLLLFACWVVRCTFVMRLLTWTRTSLGEDTRSHSHHPPLNAPTPTPLHGAPRSICVLVHNCSMVSTEEVLDMINGFKDMDIDPAAARTFVNQVRCDTLKPAPPALPYTIQAHHTRFLLVPTSWTPMAMDRSLSWSSCASCITTVSEPSAVWTQAHTAHRRCAQSVSLALTPVQPPPPPFSHPLPSRQVLRWSTCVEV